MPASRSRKVSSNQQGPHPRLKSILERHRNSSYRKPISSHTRSAFHRLQERVQTVNRPIILDSGCGNGQSTLNLARLHPEAFVIGVDKSEFRVSRFQSERTAFSQDLNNYLVVRANLIDFWLLAAGAGWRLEHHYILYPNPWPLKKHLMRRWHAHPVFPALIALGGVLHVRANWRIYLEEFASSLAFFSGKCVAPHDIAPCEPISPFEKKYHASQHRLYELIAPLSSASQTCNSL